MTIMALFTRSAAIDWRVAYQEMFAQNASQIAGEWYFSAGIINCILTFYILRYLEIYASK